MTLENKINLSICILLLLIVLTSAFLIYPTYKDIRAIFQDVVSQKQELALLEDKIKSIEGFRKNYQERKENLQKIKNLFINPKAPVEFISFLEQSSESTQSPIELSPFSVQKEGIWPSIIFRITSACPSENLFRFLDKVQSGPYLVKIESLNIKRLEEKDIGTKDLENLSVGDIQANFSLKVYTE